jgi:mevalonate kinase
MKKFTSKVLMFGEYSIMHNSMALTIPYDKFSGQFAFKQSPEQNQYAINSNKGLRDYCDHMLESHMDEDFLMAVSHFKKELDRGLFFESNIPQGFGLGSSGALVAAIFLRYLHKAGDFKDDLKNLTKEKIVSLKKHLGGLEGYFHGSSSGIDPLSILINEPLLLKSSNDIIPVKLPVSNANGKNVVFLLNTGLERNTSALVKKFNKECEKKDFKNKLNTDLIQITNSSIDHFLNADTTNLYRDLNNLVNFQLDEMNFLIPKEYEQMVANGVNNGDYFLKVCGSGGGGFMLGFTENWEETQKALKGQNLEVVYRF